MRLFFLSILTILVFTFQNCDLNITEKKRLQCLNEYIETTSKMQVYNLVRKGLMDSLQKWETMGLQMKWFTETTNVLDSAVFFNSNYTRCLFLLIKKSPLNEQYKWNFVQTLGGEKIGDNWHFYHVSFTTFSYSLKNNNYKDYSIEYLSNDARLDIINQGFFKKNSCQIDPNFVDSKDWFDDWIRKKHQQFLNGRGL